jgi:hypothetical protein
MLLSMHSKLGPIGVQLTFILLQVADIATTLAALEHGGNEQNPLVARFMGFGTVTGLMVSKLVVLAVAAAIIRFRGFRVIRMANVVFGAIVAWNISVIVWLALQSRPA